MLRDLTRTARPRLLLVCGVAAVALAACASAPPSEPSAARGERPDGEHFGHGDRHLTSGGYWSLFISPAGQPFRARRGEPYPVAAWFAAANTAHDGHLTRAEVLADATAFFQVLDADHDGVVDGFEVSLYERQIAPEIVQGFEPSAAAPRDAAGKSPDGGDSGGHGGRGGGHGGGGGGRGGGRGGGGSKGSSGTAPSQPSHATVDHPQGAAWFNLTGEAEPVASADTEFNGRITLAEFLAAVGRRFDALDPVGRGYLRLDELPHTPIQDRLGNGTDRGRPDPAPPRPDDQPPPHPLSDNR